jgi:hypothetical protein
VGDDEEGGHADTQKSNQRNVQEIDVAGRASTSALLQGPEQRIDPEQTRREDRVALMRERDSRQAERTEQGSLQAVSRQNLDGKKQDRQQSIDR